MRLASSKFILLVVRTRWTGSTFLVPSHGNLNIRHVLVCNGLLAYFARLAQWQSASFTPRPSEVRFLQRVPFFWDSLSGKTELEAVFLRKAARCFRAGPL